MRPPHAAGKTPVCLAGRGDVPVAEVVTESSSCTGRLGAPAVRSPRARQTGERNAAAQRFPLQQTPAPDGSRVDAREAFVFRILIANSKGGSGTTTVTTTLAGYYARAGRRTCLLDCDPQGSSLDWHRLRAPGRPPLHVIAGHDALHTSSAASVLRLPRDTQVLLIDTPAGLRAHEFAPFARQADVLLVPLVPSPLDLRATLDFLDRVRRLPEVRQGRLRVSLIANRLRERSVAARDLDATLQKLTQTCAIRVRDSQRYLHLAAAGLSLFDDDSAAARPHRDDWTALLNWLALREREPHSDAGAAVATGPRCNA